MEVLHIMSRLVPADLVTTGMQIGGRMFLVYLVLIPYEGPKYSPYGFPVLLLAWCISEMTRYAYYVFRLCGQVPYVLTWMRYSLFILLIPIGIVGEFLSIFAAFPEMSDVVLLEADVNVAGSHHVSIRLHHAVSVLLVAYSPQLLSSYLKLLAQRRKILSKSRVQILAEKIK